MAVFVPGPNSGRLEAGIIFLTDQTVEFTPDGGSMVSTTIPAGVEWFMSPLIEELNGSVGALFELSGGAEGIELGTGRVTITNPPFNLPFSLTWVTTELRDALGFDTNLAGAGTYTGQTHARGVWLPGTQGKFSKHGDYDPGKLTTDFRQTVGPTGTVHALSGSSYRVHEGIMWEGVPANQDIFKGKVDPKRPHVIFHPE